MRGTLSLDSRQISTGSSVKRCRIHDPALDQ